MLAESPYFPHEVAPEARIAHLVDNLGEWHLAAIREACAESRRMHAQGLRRMRERAERQLRSA